MGTISNFQTRVLTSIIGGGVFLSLLLIDTQTYLCLWLVLGILCLIEWSRLLELGKPRILEVSLITITLAFITLVSYKILNPIQLFVSGVILLLGLLLHPNITPKKIGYTLLGMAYIGIPIYILIQWGLHPQLPIFYLKPLCIMTCIWASDTGAYLVGRKWGKTPFSPRISPKKTWEGTIGGGVLVGIVAGVWATFNPYLATTAWYLGGIIAITAPIGDLIESAIKRHIEVKDAGSLLPGHGGVLDRFDACFFSVMVVFVVLC